MKTIIDNRKLHVFTARSNPMGWKTTHRNWEKFADHMIASGVTLHVIECVKTESIYSRSALVTLDSDQFLTKPTADHVCNIPGVIHHPVTANNFPWNKESLLNVGIRQSDAEYIAWIDAAVIFRNPDWVHLTLHLLKYYDVLQLWSVADDLDARGNAMAQHQSFARHLVDGRFATSVPSMTTFAHYGRSPTIPYHPGYAWAMTRDAFNRTNGLFDVAAMGSADYHMALAFLGEAHLTIPQGTNENYWRALYEWQRKAKGLKIGCVPGTIDHLYHGQKQYRAYDDRWNIFIQHQFNPYTDVIYNSQGVLEWSDYKPKLQKDFDDYLARRREDT